MSTETLVQQVVRYRSAIHRSPTKITNAFYEKHLSLVGKALALFLVGGSRLDLSLIHI